MACNAFMRSSRVELTGNSLVYVRYLDDFSAININNIMD